MKTIEPSKWTAWRYRDLAGRVQIEKRDDQYAVALDGVEVGFIEKSTRTWERGPKGANYVTRRGQTPCWRICNSTRYRSTYDTRSEAAYELAATSGETP